MLRFTEPSKGPYLGKLPGSSERPLWKSGFVPCPCDTRPGGGWKGVGGEDGGDWSVK